MSKPKKIKIVTRYDITDEDCGGDYSEVVVYVDEKEVVRFGDHYHDKGSERAESFVDGYQKALGTKIKVKNESINDYE